MAAGDSLEELARAADELVEQVTEAAMDMLRTAISEHSDGAAAAAARRDRLIARARTSLEKASRLLRDAAGGEAG